jgi:opacity protein-like surface antigen
MFKPLVACLAACVSVTCVHAAIDQTGKHKAYRHHPRADYKGEQPWVAPRELTTIYAITKTPADETNTFACTTNSFESGPYVGSSLGLKTNYTSNPAIYKGANAQLFLGVAWVSPAFYFGTEVGAGIDAEIQNYKNADYPGLRDSWNLQLGVLPGFIVADSILTYVRLGLVRTHFSDVATSVTGGQVGAGLQAAVARHWDLRGEYVYSFYETLGSLGTPRSDQFTLGLIYKF